MSKCGLFGWRNRWHRSCESIESAGCSRRKVKPFVKIGSWLGLSTWTLARHLVIRSWYWIVEIVNNPTYDSYQPPQPHPDQLEQPKNPIRQPKLNSKAGSSKLSKTNITCSTINNTTAHATQWGCPQMFCKHCRHFYLILSRHPIHSWILWSPTEWI